MLAEELGRIDGIESAFVYASFAVRMLGDAGPAPRDIDVMVLGEPEFAESSSFLENVRRGPAARRSRELPWR